MLNESSDMSAAVLALKAGASGRLLMPVAEDAKQIVSRWEPQAVVLQAGLPDWLAPLGSVDDVHTRVWRLRRMLGDHARPRPLIVNRRGFGYAATFSA